MDVCALLGPSHKCSRFQRLIQTACLAALHRRQSTEAHSFATTDLIVEAVCSSLRDCQTGDTEMQESATEYCLRSSHFPGPLHRMGLYKALTTTTLAISSNPICRRYSDHIVPSDIYLHLHGLYRCVARANCVLACRQVLAFVLNHYYIRDFPSSQKLFGMFPC